MIKPLEEIVIFDQVCRILTKVGYYLLRLLSLMFIYLHQMYLLFTCFYEFSNDICVLVAFIMTLIY